MRSPPPYDGPPGRWDGPPGRLQAAPLQARDGMGRQQTVGAVGVRQAGEDGEEGRKADGMGLLQVGWDGPPRERSPPRGGRSPPRGGRSPPRDRSPPPADGKLPLSSDRFLQDAPLQELLQGTASARWVTSAGLLTARWSWRPEPPLSLLRTRAATRSALGERWGTFVEEARRRVTVPAAA